MNFFDTNLSSDLDRRRLVLSPSGGSGGALGLGLRDIVPKLVDRNHKFSEALTPKVSLDERIFNALANAKIWTSKVAMHMDLAQRDRYFRQLDLLHDSDEWFGDESPVQLESYKAFIRFMLSLGSNSKPALALSASGNLIAVWLAGEDRLTVEFRPGGEVEWVISRREGEKIERFAGTNSWERIQAVVAPYHPEAWFNVG